MNDHKMTAQKGSKYSVYSVYYSPYPPDILIFIALLSKFAIAIVTPAQESSSIHLLIPPC